MTDLYETETKPLMARVITGCTLVAFSGPFPRERGNCFSVMANNGNHYRIVNFNHENMTFLQGFNDIEFPIQIKALDEGHAVIHDARIPDEFYQDTICSVCCPSNLSPDVKSLALERANEKLSH